MTDYIYPLRIDWPAVLSDIKAAGVSYRAQAKKIGVEWPTFQRWLGGTEPVHSIATAMLVLHTRHCGEAKTLQRCNEARAIESRARTSGSSGPGSPLLAVCTPG